MDTEDNAHGFHSKNESLVQNINAKVKESVTLVASLQNNTQIVDQDPVVLKAKQQLGTAFRCLLLPGITLFNADPIYYERIPDIIQAHRLVRQSGMPNLLGLRIPIQTQLNVLCWRYYLRDYFDQHHPYLVQFRFPLDFDRNCILGHTMDNHISANQFSEVGKYIQGEQSFKAMLGQFNDPIPLYISPLMTQDKAGWDKRRTIVDLSWSKGLNNGVSNCSYLGTQFELKYPTVDSIVTTLKKLGPATKVLKLTSAGLLDMCA